MLLNKIPLLKLGIVFVMLLSGIYGCTTKPYQDISSSIPSQPLSVPKGEFESVAWLDENHIAFIYKPDKLPATDIDMGFRIGIFEISTRTTSDLS